MTRLDLRPSVSPFDASIALEIFKGRFSHVAALQPNNITHVCTYVCSRSRNKSCKKSCSLHTFSPWLPYYSCTPVCSPLFIEASQPARWLAESIWLLISSFDRPLSRPQSEVEKGEGRREGYLFPTRSPSVRSSDHPISTLAASIERSGFRVQWLLVL